MKKINWKRVGHIVMACIIPGFCILEGISNIISGMLPTWTLLLMFFVIPGSALALGICIICSNMALENKVLSCIAMAVLIPIVSFVPVVLCGRFVTLKETQGTAAVEVFQEETEEIPVLSEIAGLERAEEIEYVYHKLDISFFSNLNHTLISRYSETDYLLIKESLDEMYTFQQEPLTAAGYSIEPYATVGDHRFRFLTMEYDCLEYPKKMVLIGTSDTAHEIVYVFFDGYDLDFIRSVEDFIENTCGWRYIS